MSSFALQKSFSSHNYIERGLDLIAICAGGWISYQIRFSNSAKLAILSPSDELLILSVALFFALFFDKINRILPGGAALAATAGRVAGGWLLIWSLLIVLLALTKTVENMSRIWLVTWLGTTIVTLWIGRLIAFFIAVRMHRAGYLNKKVLLYGDISVVRTVGERITQATGSGYTILDTISFEDERDIETMDAAIKPDEIWIGVKMSDQAQLDCIMHKLRHSVANIRLLPDLRMYQLLNQGMSVTVGIPMVNISISPIYGTRKIAKNVVDYTVASLALVLLSPLFLVIAIAIKLTSKGPVLFHQKRHGWNGTEIWVYKFRSMVAHKEVYGSVTQATRGDSRVTPIGNFLRKTSLDELPQFFNVLQGKMSVVGPRPHALKHNHVYSKLIPRYALRHKVKPGITGWAQVCGFRGETDTLDKMEGRIRHDIYYLEHWSLWMDLKIIALTPLATIQNKNVY
jgi:Undecaprenyl-phosphate glucose phosphotransferase